MQIIANPVEAGMNAPTASNNSEYVKIVIVVIAPILLITIIFCSNSTTKLTAFVTTIAPISLKYIQDYYATFYWKIFM